MSDLRIVSVEKAWGVKSKSGLAKVYSPPHPPPPYGKKQQPAKMLIPINGKPFMGGNEQYNFTNKVD